MKFKYQIDSADLKKFQIHYLLNSKLVLLSVGIVLIFIIANILLMYSRIYNQYILITRVLFFVLVALLMLYAAIRKIQNNSKNSIIFGEYELEIKDDVVYFNKNGFIKRIRTENYIRYSETRNYIYLFLTRSYANIIPKFKIEPSSETENLLSYIREKIPNGHIRKTQKKKALS